MTADDIWHKVFEQKNPEIAKEVSEEQKRLFYFIHFTIDIQMGGFVYNHTPAQAGDNFYLPYIESLKFFGFTKAADLLTEFNDEYIKALSTANTADGWYDMCVEAGIEPLLQQVEVETNNIVDNELGSVTSWIAQHREKLIIGLQ